jgi:predicted RNA binding protein YcfA (HicA-like mRNA interferase family)
MYYLYNMKSSELLRILLADGWYIYSQNGSHAKLRHPVKIAKNNVGFLLVAVHGSKEVPKGTEKDILKQAGLR